MPHADETVTIGMNPDGSPRKWKMFSILVSDANPGPSPSTGIKTTHWTRKGTDVNIVHETEYREEFKIVVSDTRAGAGVAEEGLRPWSKVTERSILFKRGDDKFEIRFHVVKGKPKIGVHIDEVPACYIELEEVEGEANCFVEIPAEKLLGASALSTRLRERLARRAGG